MANPNQKISMLLSQIQNCPSIDSGAKQMEKLVQEGVAHLDPLTKATEHLLSIRAKASQRGLKTDVVHYLEQYWLTDDKVNRMSKLAQARAQACLLLEQVLATTKK
jgi:molybdenum-dependent DNA-binding transcriptional regulator ModE